MVNKCSVFGCFTNFKGHEGGTVFNMHSLKDLELKKKWIKFINRKDIDLKSECVFVCVKHFEEKFIKRNNERPRLIKELNPVPSIYPLDVYKDKPSCIPSVASSSRKAPTERNLHEDESNIFENKFKINSFNDVDEKLLEYLDCNYHIKKYPDHVVYYKLEVDDLSIPSVTETIRIDSKLHVLLFFKGAPLPLPNWFRKGSGCILTYKDMLTNFSAYIRASNEDKRNAILEEIMKLSFKKNPIYSANLLRYSLLLRYTSLPAYKLLQDEFKLPSISFLRKISSGKIDTIKSAQCLLKNGSISRDVVLIFDEMYLQKSEEFVGGESIGVNENGELYKIVTL